MQWWIGDWLNFGEGRPKWGDKYEAAVEALAIPYGTLTEYKYVARQFEFSKRMENLSWSHHHALASQPGDVRKKLLKEAEPDEAGQKPKLSVSQIKKEAKRIKRESSTPAMAPAKCSAC